MNEYVLNRRKNANAFMLLEERIERENFFLRQFLGGRILMGMYKFIYPFEKSGGIRRENENGKGDKERKKKMGGGKKFVVYSVFAEKFVDMFSSFVFHCFCP